MVAYRETFLQLPEMEADEAIPASRSYTRSRWLIDKPRISRPATGSSFSATH
jgi:hypothetical protein